LDTDIEARGGAIAEKLEQITALRQLEVLTLAALQAPSLEAFTQEMANS
jgi:hypothetical protein